MASSTPFYLCRYASHLPPSSIGTPSLKIICQCKISRSLSLTNASNLINLVKDAVRKLLDVFVWLCIFISSLDRQSSQDLFTLIIVLTRAQCCLYGCRRLIKLVLFSALVHQTVFVMQSTLSFAVGQVSVHEYKCRFILSVTY